MDSWKTLSRETVLDRGKFLRVEDHTVQLPDGRIIEQWPWIITPDFINVVAVTDAGEFLCFHQVKYAVEGEALAPIGGYLEPGEEPLAAAKRELLEETGYEASEWIDSGPLSRGCQSGRGHRAFLSRAACAPRHRSQRRRSGRAALAASSRAPKSRRRLDTGRIQSAPLGGHRRTGTAPPVKDSLQSSTAS